MKLGEVQELLLCSKVVTSEEDGGTLQSLERGNSSHGSYSRAKVLNCMNILYKGNSPHGSYGISKVVNRMHILSDYGLALVEVIQSLYLNSNYIFSEL